jgi:hypothetical protein
MVQAESVHSDDEVRLLFVEVVSHRFHGESGMIMLKPNKQQRNCQLLRRERKISPMLTVFLSSFILATRVRRDAGRMPQ